MVQILDAALVEFSERGFAAARMDDIARRCGLSKGGLYAHFAGKEEVFEALLTRSLAPPDLGEMPVLGAGVRPMAQWVVDKLYDSLGRPGAVATLRLLVAESARVPHLIVLWKRNVVQPHLILLGDILRAHAVQEGVVPSVITQEPWLALSPVVHALLSQVVLGGANPQDLDHYRQGHVALLCELLDPASRILPQPVPQPPAK
ncbi:helix-turn-helix domain-containing protein [Acidovorax carolinensis]|uniref:TetR/AcrR family transcriptional regulator n=1 Tax=Acidovorax carolinensis TaxID=553814 RepID=UPI00269C7CF5